MNRSAKDFGLFLLRFALACVFIYHGAQKVFGWFDGFGLGPFSEDLTRLRLPFPYFSAVLASSAQLLGGMSLLLGLGTRYMLAPLAFTMLVASIVDGRSGFSNQHGGAEFPFVCLCGVLAVWLLGPGRFSVNPLIQAQEEGR